MERVVHPIEPYYTGDSKILILGSFPSVKSRESGFFYGHPRNRFWRVISDIFGSRLPVSVDEKKALLKANNIALWDVIGSCSIQGSSDASITDVVPSDIKMIVRNSAVRTVLLNGRTAEICYKRYIAPEVDLPFYVLPSTSPANASCGYEELLKAWRAVVLNCIE